MSYPAAPDALNALIADVRKRARPDGGVAPKVVIAPHAGLVYSGTVAATAFGAWARRLEPPRRIVIIGPAHRVAFSGVAVHPASKWRTPLGEIPVAGVTPAGLAQAPGVVIDSRPFAGEHSLEMHLIMLQAMLPRRSKSSPSWSATRIPTRSQRPCAESGAGRRRSSQSHPTCRIFSIR
jgi:AmmeMemoRadiSam system protein B